MRQVEKGANIGFTVSTLCSSMKREDRSSDNDDEEYGSREGPSHHVEKERRIRREIANNNERRRMQSINTGFQALRSMLPHRDGGEKLSKAAVLQHASEHMSQIIDERKRLVAHNQELTSLLKSQQNLPLRGPVVPSGDSLKRRKTETESSDEGIGMTYLQQQSCDQHIEIIDELRHELAELRVQLDRERQKSSYYEQSAYRLMASQMSQQQQQSPSAAVLEISPAPIGCSPAQSNTALSQANIPVNVTEQQDIVEADSEQTTSRIEASHTEYNNTNFNISGYQHASTFPVHPPETQSVVTIPHSAESDHITTYNKASSVASRNLSIIVEAINHLEGDTQRPTESEKEADSGVSNSESCDETKSEGSGTPLPPPAHQHPTHNLFSPDATARLMYRSTHMTGLATGSAATPPAATAQRY